jgi:hypothetical protein
LSGNAARREGEEARRTLTAMSVRQRTAAPVGTARCVIDYALARRSALAAYASGRMRRGEICDADPYLLRAARYHGEPTESLCPVCRDTPLVTVTYTFGVGFRAELNGRARATRELAVMAREYPDFTVYVVEVCSGCRWNHLLTSYVLGTGEPVRRRARS